ncbi:hypothetical protein CHS0354_013448 [Potamilus streckersoni]|uniref:VWFA domain-containing protein n=1 Tax=Potamilus streckersoni TaxID=2493646 RepID=A0AAE0RZA1_9BIVA|nr:hypothetical protein CHS0354_013448 [Potamilus streckersoni]
MFDVGQGPTQAFVGILTFDNKVMIDYTLDNFSDMESLIDALEKIQHKEGTTRNTCEELDTLTIQMSTQMWLSPDLSSPLIPISLERFEVVGSVWNKADAQTRVVVDEELEDINSEMLSEAYKLNKEAEVYVIVVGKTKSLPLIHELAIVKSVVYEGHINSVDSYQKIFPSK